MGKAAARRAASETTAPATTAAETQAPADTGAADTGAAADTTASECAQENLNLVNDGTLTIGTGNPAFPPWFGGGETGNEFKFNDPANGKGYESAVAYAIAEQLGFTPDQVVWIADVPSTRRSPRAPKKYDFNIQQIGITQKRAKAVDFSDGYYDNVQAVVSVKGSTIDGATTARRPEGREAGRPGRHDELRLRRRRHPARPGAGRVYDDQAGAVQALENGQVDGIVTDLYTAYYLRDAEIENGIIVGPVPGRCGERSSSA